MKKKKKPTVTFSFPNDTENRYEIKCHFKAVELNIAASDALELIRGRLKYGQKVSKEETKTLEQIREILWGVYVEG